MHTQVAGHVADVAAGTNLSSSDLVRMTIQLLADADAAALLVLLVAVALSVYKPRGLTRYGWVAQAARAARPAAAGRPGRPSRRSDRLLIPGQAQRAWPAPAEACLLEADDRANLAWSGTRKW